MTDLLRVFAVFPDFFRHLLFSCISCLIGSPENGRIQNSLAEQHGYRILEGNSASAYEPIESAPNLDDTVVIRSRRGTLTSLRNEAFQQHEIVVATSGAPGTLNANIEQDPPPYTVFIRDENNADLPPSDDTQGCASEV